MTTWSVVGEEVSVIEYFSLTGLVILPTPSPFPLISIQVQEGHSSSSKQANFWPSNILPNGNNPDLLSFLSDQTT